MSPSIKAKRNTKNQSGEVEKVQKADLAKSEKSARNNLTSQKDFRTDSTEIVVGINRKGDDLLGKGRRPTDGIGQCLNSPKDKLACTWTKAKHQDSSKAD